MHLQRLTIQNVGSSTPLFWLLFPSPSSGGWDAQPRSHYKLTDRHWTHFHFGIKSESSYSEDVLLTHLPFSVMKRSHLPSPLRRDQI